MLHLTQPTPHIARLTLSSPARRNALTHAAWAELPTRLAALPASTRVLILAGEGAHFSAGADISEFESTYADSETAAHASARIATALDALANLPLPTIAEVRGACIGGGTALALACDIRMGDPTARFGVTPAKLGLVYPFGDIRRLVDTVGLARARDLLLTARHVDADEAIRIGLLTQLYPADALKAATRDLAETLASLSPASARAHKALLARISSGQREPGADTDTLFARAFTSEDFRKGTRAFLEKRKPEF